MKAVTGSREQLVARSCFPLIVHRQEFGKLAFTHVVWAECFWHCSAVPPLWIQLHSQAPESFQVLQKQAQEQLQGVRPDYGIDLQSSEQQNSEKKKHRGFHQYKHLSVIHQQGLKKDICMHWVINQLLAKWEKKKIFLGADLANSCFWQGFFVLFPCHFVVATHWHNALGYMDRWPEQVHGNSYNACAERLLLRDLDRVWFDLFQNGIALVPVDACSWSGLQDSSRTEGHILSGNGKIVWPV